MDIAIGIVDLGTGCVARCDTAGSGQPTNQEGMIGIRIATHTIEIWLAFCGDTVPRRFRGAGDNQPCQHHRASSKAATAKGKPAELYPVMSSGEETMKGVEDIKILFVAGFGPIVRDPSTSRKLYDDVLGIRFKVEKEESADYLHTEALEGAKTFALWPLSQAAYACFGRYSWPEDIPVPQAWLEFDVDSVEKATATVEARGHRVLVKNKKEPWGQTVSRFLSPEGLLVGLTFTPMLRETK